MSTAGGSSPMSNQFIALESKTLKQKATATVSNANFTIAARVFAERQRRSRRRVAGSVPFDGAALASGPVASTASLAARSSNRARRKWEDAQNTRWIAVLSSRGIVMFKVADDNGKLALQTGWTSRHSIAAPPLVVNGVLHASSGTKAVPSVLYAIDASNGKELSSLRTIATSVRGGLSAGQGTVYVPGADGTLYAFGRWRSNKLKAVRGRTAAPS
jgi:outer membrane protein assembly factor BamB